MKMPINCPCCGAPLLNEFRSTLVKEYLRKSCGSRLDHRFACTSYDEPYDVMYSMGIEIDTENMIRVNWMFDIKQMFVCKGEDDTHSLPYFEPDLSDYRKLVAKLRTYVMFS